MSFDFETAFVVAFTLTLATFLYTMLAAWVRWLIRYGPPAFASLAIGSLAIEHPKAMAVATVSGATFLVARIILSRIWLSR